MRERSLFVFLLLAASAPGQQIVLIPATGSTAVSVPPAFAGAVSFPVASGTFSVLAHPSGDRFFAVAPASVTVVDGSGRSLQGALTLKQTATGAVLTPDGHYLAVTATGQSAGSLYLSDVSAPSATQTAAVPLNVVPSGVAASFDSTQAYVLSATGVTRVDLGLRTAAQTRALAGIETDKSSIVIAANGLLYVNARNALYEIDPRTLRVLNTITISGFPAVPVLTPDGRSALVANPGAAAGAPALLSIDLTTHRVSKTLPWFGTTMDALIYAGGSIFVHSAGARALLEVSADLGTVRAAGFPGATLDFVDAVFTSGESPAANYLYVAAPAVLYRIDLTAAQQPAKALPLATPVKRGYCFTPPSTGTPAAAVAYNTVQDVIAGDYSIPLAVRVTDSRGLPVFGASVSFNPTIGKPLSQMTSTNSDGLAEAIVQAPRITGPMGVTANVPGLAQAAFVINSLDPAAAPEVGLPGISIVSGNGQVLANDGAPGEPLAVMVRDDAGLPAVGARVSYQITGGSATIVAPSCLLMDSRFVCTTDGSGQASVIIAGTADTLSGAALSDISVVAWTDSGASVAFVEHTIPVMLSTGAPGVPPTYTILAPLPGAIIQGTAGRTLAAAIRVAVTSPAVLGALPVPGVGIDVRSTRVYNASASSPVSCAQAGGVSDGAGIATCDLVLGRAPGLYQLYIVMGGSAAFPFAVQINPAPAGTVAASLQILQGNNQSGPGTVTLPDPLVALATNRAGIPLAGAAVEWTVVSGSALLSNASTETDPSGQASAYVTLGAKAGPVVVRLSAGGASIDFTLTATAGPAGVAIVSGDAQTAAPGEMFPMLVVQVTGADGAGLDGIPVVFSAASGSVAPASITVITDPSGLAGASFSAGDSIGPVDITATAGNSSATFHLEVRKPGVTLAASGFLNGASLLPGVVLGGIAVIEGEGLTAGLNLTPGNCVTGTGTGGYDAGLPLRLARIEVQFGSLLAPVFSVCRTAASREQVTVQVPFELAPATITAYVRTGMGAASQLETAVPGIQVLAAQPAVFSVQRPDGTVVSATNPARRGETVQATATGLGWVLPASKTNQSGRAGQAPFGVVNAQLDGTTLAATAAYAEHMIGTYLVSFQIPSDAAAGPDAALALSLLAPDGKTFTGPAIRIPIQ